ncbi:cyclase family protein [Haloarculaceae archaeon H-GB1-1]|nr:cyclase family protein [Haloarculaceae archaeon H-GB1-1]
MTCYDLTHALETGMPVYPGSPPAVVERAATIDDGARVTRLDLETHVGTHVDAPSHMARDGASLDDFDVERFRFDALRVDCTHLGAREPISPSDLPSPTDHDLLAFHTGWDDHWGTDAYRDHPYLSDAAAEWCADNGYSVGLDAFSPDPTPSVDPDREGPDEPEGYPAHDALFEAESFIVENLTNLDAPPAEFTLLAFPLAIVDADGSPVRAVADAG